MVFLSKDTSMKVYVGFITDHLHCIDMSPYDDHDHNSEYIPMFSRGSVHLTSGSCASCPRLYYLRALSRSPVYCEIWLVQGAIRSYLCLLGLLVYCSWVVSP